MQDAPTGCLIILCANKADQPLSNWKVSREEFQNFAALNNLTIFEASASKGTNVNEVIYSIFKYCLAKYSWFEFFFW